GEIHGTTVRDGSVSMSVARFAKTRLRSASAVVSGPDESHAIGARIASELVGDGLRAIFVLSDGLNVNGSELVRGINGVVGPDVVVTGGLAGDGTRFEKTWVLAGKQAGPNLVGAVGLYGDHVVVQHGSLGGWDAFGPERTVTRASANVLFELDGKPALDLYKQYLGE
ncbi:MAG: hypothetical protein KC656_38310, partial [Myxococcales bacterium]|nr:hypothetical protein [Myxococcales bacterium]